MHHNDVGYLHYLQSLSEGDPDLPSPRVCRLLRRLFQRWRDKPRWLSEQQTGHLFRHLPAKKRAPFEAQSRAIRKGLAVRRMLELLVDEKVAKLAGTCEIDP